MDAPDCFCQAGISRQSGGSAGGCNCKGSCPNVPGSIPGGALTDEQIYEASVLSRVDGWNGAIAIENAITAKADRKKYREARKRELEEQRLCQRQIEKEIKREYGAALRKLSDKEKQIAWELLSGPMTKREISERFGVPVEEIRALAERLSR